MKSSQLVVVAGCNAAGKSGFIRSRINELEGFEIIMTDVYKGRTKEVFTGFLKQKKNIILETVFNDASFKDLIDEARNNGYKTQLILLFLDSPSQSLNRVTSRMIQQNGLYISGGNVKINFNESFKNTATYFIYFDFSDFFYTGLTGKNQLVMSFERSLLVSIIKIIWNIRRSLANTLTIKIVLAKMI